MAAGTPGEIVAGDAAGAARGRRARRGPAPRALRLWLQLLITTQQVEKQLRARLRSEFGTTLPQFDVLAALHRFPAGQTMGELSRWLLVSNGNVTGIVRRLEGEGMVERIRPERDRRAHLIRLTRHGRDAFEAMAEIHEQWVEELFRPLGPPERESLRGALAKIRTERMAAAPARGP